MKYSEKVSNKLNELLERTHDAEKGYRLVRDKVGNESLKDFFQAQMKQRHDFGHRLQEQIHSFGELPQEGGSIKGDLHRTWIDLTSSLATNKEERLLQETVRGENNILDLCTELLDEGEGSLPEATERLLREQKKAITASIDRAKHFETVLS